MKIQVLSDLHLEFDRNERRPWTRRFQAIPETDADVIVLAGDIDTGLRGLRWAIGEAARLERPILYVFGNHEYYGQAMPRLLMKVRKLVEGTGVRLLEKDRVMLDGIRFLGCTLWTDFDLLGDRRRAMDCARSTMNDYGMIRTRLFRKLKPEDAMEEHRSSRAWLEQQLAAPRAPPTVVVTHHAPSLRSLPPELDGHELSAAYASNLEPLIGPPVVAWIHGHLHNPIDYELNGVRVLSNPRGYFPHDLAAGFDPKLTVDEALT